MNKKQKMSYIGKCVNRYANELLIDQKYHFSIKEADEQPPDDKEASVLNEALRLEETVVSQLEYALLGHEKKKRVYSILKKGKGGTLAILDDSSSQYWSISIKIYPRMMEYDGQEFKDVCDATILHEILHVVLLPLSAYTHYLEDK